MCVRCGSEGGCNVQSPVVGMLPLTSLFQEPQGQSWLELSVGHPALVTALRYCVLTSRLFSPQLCELLQGSSGLIRL